MAFMGSMGSMGSNGKLFYKINI